MNRVKIFIIFAFFLTGFPAVSMNNPTKPSTELYKEFFPDTPTPRPNKPSDKRRKETPKPSVDLYKEFFPDTPTPRPNKPSDKRRKETPKPSVDLYKEFYPDTPTQLPTIIPIPKDNPELVSRSTHHDIVSKLRNLIKESKSLAIGTEIASIDAALSLKVVHYAQLIVDQKKDPLIPAGRFLHPFSCTRFSELHISDAQACSYKSLKSIFNKEKIIEKLTHFKDVHPDFFKNLKPEPIIEKITEVLSFDTPVVVEPPLSARVERKQSSSYSTYRFNINKLQQNRATLKNSLSGALADKIITISIEKKRAENRDYFHPLSCIFFGLPGGDTDPACSHTALKRLKFPHTLDFKINHFKEKHPEFYSQLEWAAQQLETATLISPEEPSSKKARTRDEPHS